MAYKIKQSIPTARELIQAYPLSDKARVNVDNNRQQIAKILSGDDDRLLVIVGPCSAWPTDAVLDYAKRLLDINRQVGDYLKLVMRVYIQKPRTIKGWVGLVNQPDPLKSPDIVRGMFDSRKLMVDIAEIGLAIADEALFINNYGGFMELLSWIAVGARSSENPEHRYFASAVDCPVGIKNPTHGSLKVAVNSVVAAQHSHVTVIDGKEVETDGNLFAHVVLRGGGGKPNYSISHLDEINQYIKQSNVANPSLIIDVSHDNCIIDNVKNPLAQPDIVLKIMNDLHRNPHLKKIVKGFMLESFIKDGNQNIDFNQPIDYAGLSITDPCLGIDKTEKLLLDLVSFIKASKNGG